MKNPYFFDFQTKEEADHAMLNRKLIFKSGFIIDGIVVRVAGEEVFRVRIATGDDGQPVMVMIADIDAIEGE